MTRLRVLSILTGFCSTLELVYRVVPGFCPTLTFKLIHNGQTHSCYYIKKSKCFLKKFSFKCFFCYGLKLYDFLNVYHFFCYKSYIWMASFYHELKEQERKSKFAFKWFFCHGLKLNDFLNLNQIFCYKSRIWMASFYHEL